MIANIQLLRALAALAVVFYHTAYILPGAVHTEFGAVSLFFVISGFIMTYITRKDARFFLFDRFARIVPIYWICTLFVFVWFGSGIGNFVYLSHLAYKTLLGNWRAPAQIFYAMANSCTAPHLGVLFKSLFFIPMPPDQGPTIGVGWSLDFEVFYYLVFAAALRVNLRFAPLIVALVLLAIRPWADENDNFVLGIGLYYVWLHAAPLAQKYRRYVGVPALCCIAYYLYANATGAAFVGEYSPALLVFVVLMLEAAGWRCLWAPALLLGDASYVLYLAHELVLESMRPFGDILPFLATAQSGFAALLAVVLSIALALAVHLWIERPVLAALRRYKKKKQEAATYINASARP